MGSEGNACFDFADLEGVPCSLQHCVQPGPASIWLGPNFFRMRLTRAKLERVLSRLEAAVDGRPTGKLIFTDCSSNFCLIDCGEPPVVRLGVTMGFDHKQHQPMKLGTEQIEALMPRLREFMLAG
jgi:hypothetical protein